MCRRPLAQVKAADIIDFATTLFPIKTASDPLDMLYKNMDNFYQIKMDKGLEF
jgi:hypothetical protein